MQLIKNEKKDRKKKEIVKEGEIQTSRHINAACSLEPDGDLSSSNIYFCK